MDQIVGDCFINETSFDWSLINLNDYDCDLLYSSQIIHFRKESVPMQWILTLYKEWTDEGVIYTIYLILNSPIDLNVSVKCTYTFLATNSRGESGIKMKSLSNFDFGPEQLENYSSHTIKEPNIWLMIVTCDFNTNLTKQIRSSESELSDELHSCLENKTFSDLTFTVGEKEFHAHKVILAARSPAFSAMFASEMQENIHNHVDITDAEPDVFCEMLRYIYSGKISEIETCATDLIVLAEKYDLRYLKKMCENAIMDNVIKIENAGDILILADVYSPLRLKPQVIEYIVKYFDEFANTEKHKAMEGTHSQLLLSVYQARVADLSSRLTQLKQFNIKK